MANLANFAGFDGALLIDKSEGLSSFDVIRQLQKCLDVPRKQQPKLGHGGTLDPFATGLLIVCVGRGVKLARYFLGSEKIYDATVRFGETTVPGDPTAEISARTDTLPASLASLREAALHFTAAPYLQTPPMHSAKKVDGKPLYELARQGIEIEREAKECLLHRLEIHDYAPPRARISVACSSGTYIRTLAQDLARHLGSLALLESLRRTGTGGFTVAQAWTVEKIAASGATWDELPCWVPFDRLLPEFPRALITEEEARALQRGQQEALVPIMSRTPEDPASPMRALYAGDQLIAVAGREQGIWGLERVFVATED